MVDEGLVMDGLYTSELVGQANIRDRDVLS